MDGDIVLASDKKRSSRFGEFMKKWGVAIMDVTVIIVAIIVSILKGTKSATLDILVAPTDAIVRINGDVYSSKEAVNMYPGAYNIEISAEGFEPKNFTLNLEDGFIRKLHIYLTGEDGDLSPYEDSTEDLSVLREVGDDEVDEFLSRLSIEEILPIIYESDATDLDQYKSFSISYNTEDCKEKSYCLMIWDVFEGNYDLALSLIRKYGYDPADYEILYKYTCDKNNVEQCDRI